MCDLCLVSALCCAASNLTEANVLLKEAYKHLEEANKFLEEAAMAKCIDEFKLNTGSLHEVGADETDSAAASGYTGTYIKDSLLL